MAQPIGVIGGSGLYSLLPHADDVVVDTPYGAPSDPLVVADVAGRPVVFLPRHGRDHRHPPHRVPYLANLWALRSLGVRQVIAPCAVGALDRSLSPGDLVVPDQILDRTSGRQTTYDDDGAVHVPFADPTARVVVRLPSKPRGKLRGRPATAARWSSSTALGSARALSRSGTHLRAAPSST